jgi:tRNA (guanine37-N1)-methyltransferase
MELSIGDYVLSGGELAGLVLIDAIARLLPNVLGDSQSSVQDSFSAEPSAGGERLLDCPHYTKPREWMGRAVPDVLLSGDHERIAAWRLQQKRERTKQRRGRNAFGPASEQ